MARLKGPLFSLGASGKLANTLVFFPWKGIDAVRSYVVPANPKSSGQTTQRGYMTSAVSAIHTAMADATKPLVDADKQAYALWASIVRSATTWFNQATKNYIDVSVAGDTPTVFRGGASTPGDGELAVEIYSDEVDGTDITAATFFYGTSPSALLSSEAAAVTPATDKLDATLSGLTNGTKYYWQLQVDTGENCEGCKSGIYYGTPSA